VKAVQMSSVKRVLLVEDVKLEAVGRAFKTVGGMFNVEMVYKRRSDVFMASNGQMGWVDHLLLTWQKCTGQSEAMTAREFLRFRRHLGAFRQICSIFLLLHCFLQIFSFSLTHSITYLAYTCPITKGTASINADYGSLR
jgi:hypothetical protein